MKHTTKTSESHTKASKSKQTKAEARRIQKALELEEALLAEREKHESESMADLDYATQSAEDAADLEFAMKTEGKSERKLERLRKAELKKLRQQKETPAQEYKQVRAELHLPEYINADDDEELKVMEEIHGVDPISDKSYKGAELLLQEEIVYEKRMKSAAEKAANRATAKIEESLKSTAAIIKSANAVHLEKAIPLAPAHRFIVGEHVQVTSTVQPARYRLPGGAEILRFKQYNGIVTYVNPDVEWITVDLGMYRESYNPRLVLKGWSSRLPTFMSMLSAVGRFSTFEEKNYGTSRLAEILGIPADKLNLTNDAKDSLSLVPTDAIEVTQNHTIGIVEESAGVSTVKAKTADAVDAVDANLSDVLEMQPLKMGAAKSRAVKTSTTAKEPQL